MKIGNKNFQKDVIISGILHLIILIGLGLSMPPMFDKLPEPENIIIFDLLPVSDKVNIKTQSKKTEVIEKVSISQIKKSSIIEKKIEEVTKSEPKKEVIVEKIIENIAPVKIKKEIKPVDKKNIAKEDTIDSLLKNLENELNDNKIASEVKDKQLNKDEGEKYFKGDEFDQRSPMSITETMLIKRLIEKNWRIPQSIQNLKNIKITAEIFLNTDGTIVKTNIINIVCPHSKQICALAEESIIRAIKTTNQIENLSPSRYDSWRNLKLVFDPSSIF